MRNLKMKNHNPHKSSFIIALVLKIVPTALALSGLACTTLLPDRQSATQIGLWDQVHGYVKEADPQKGAFWRSIEVPFDGVLEINVDYQSVESDLDLFLYKDSSEEAFDASTNKAKGNKKEHLKTEVTKGKYYIKVLAESKASDFKLQLRYLPTDPEVASGPNFDMNQASLLPENQTQEGSVSFREGNRTDWYKIQLNTPGTSKLQLSLLGSNQGIVTELLEEGQAPKPFTGTETIKVSRPRTFFVKIMATDPSSLVKYRLAAQTQKAQAFDKNGKILRITNDSLILNLGTVNNMQVGFKGLIERNNGENIEFVIEKVLRQTSKAKVSGSVNGADVGKSVYILGNEQP